MPSHPTDLDPTTPFDRAAPDRFEAEREQLRRVACSAIEDYLEWGKPPATVRRLLLDSLRAAFTDEPPADPEGCSEVFRGLMIAAGRDRASPYTQETYLAVVQRALDEALP